MNIDNNLYQENILDHYNNPRNYGVLKNPHYSSESKNISCGDRICLQILLSRDINKDAKKIKQIKWSGTGCAICMASASMLSIRSAGKKIRDLERLKKKDVLNLMKISLSPVRLKCALLPLETLKKVLGLVKDDKDVL